MTHYIVAQPSDDERLDSDFPTVIGPFVSDEAAITWGEENLEEGTWDFALGGATGGVTPW